MTLTSPGTAATDHVRPGPDFALRLHPDTDTDTDPVDGVVFRPRSTAPADAPRPRGLSGAPPVFHQRRTRGGPPTTWARPLVG